ncbi:MAG TPA: response regulator transcription factor [Solirubrobacteraceae bacterium]|nr:response regulator transcription factor [Solirubrobacteraceae bacterium]
MEQPRPPVSVLIADDHRLMREGTAALLRIDPRIEVVGMASNGREALSLVATRSPDVVVLDLDMPELGGLEACAAIRSRHPEVEVLILTVSENAPDLWAALRVGARGYLVKDMPPAELVAAILDAAVGQPHIAPRMAGRMLNEFARSNVQAVGDPLVDLSPREREVLALLAGGMRNREIADRLVLSEATVKTHVRHILEKLHLRNRSEAAVFATRHHV